MFINEAWRNATDGYLIGESEPYEPFTEDTGELYRSLVKEYGRCTGRVRIDTKSEEGMPIGWVFIQRARYEDTGESYLRETWVTLYDELDTVIRTQHYHRLKS